MEKLKTPVFYHEDLYRQIEFVPEENYFASKLQIDELSNKEPDPYHLEVRPERIIPLLERKIPFAEIKQILDPISMVFSDDIETGYGQTSFKDQNVVAWGFEFHYGIFVKDKDGSVEAIWITYSHLFSDIRTFLRLQKALFEIMHRYSLIILDWEQEAICRATSEQDVEEFLKNKHNFL